ncbi:MAG: methyl-accepting chemotaxis protein [Desulfobacterales bacterium]|nr:methyl-accepting chemotaxis protein [Desulfobacterales bacterium]
MKLSGIGTKLISLTGILVLITCLTVTFINYRIGRSCMGKFLQVFHMPAVMENISAVVDNRITRPAKALDLVAENPFLIQWIQNGEPREGRETVYQLLRKVSSSLETRGANVVLWENQSYYDISKNTASFKNLTPSDTWFKAFKESRKVLDINLHINDKVYGSVAFINRRIEDKGQFLGLTSVSLDLETFSRQVADTVVGKKGETYMVDREGNVMLHRDKALIHNLNLVDKSGWGDHLTTVLSTDESVIRIKGHDGSPVIAMTRFVPELGWYLVAEANEDEMIENVTHALFKDMNGAFFIIILANIVLLTAGVGACLVFSYRSIIRPINETVARIKDIATGEGDLTLRLPGDRKDEIGELALWVNTFMEKLQQIVGRISENAQTVSQASEKLLAVSVDLVRESRDTSEKASTASQATEQTDSGINAIAATMEETAGQAAGITTAAGEMRANSETLAQGAVKARRETGAAVAVSDKALETIQHMDKAARDIEAISETVSEISEQTKLLSLNATIEASRVGVYGKGFAVVADEIRGLSRQTAKAIEDIQDTVQGIREASRESMDEINGMTDAVKTADTMVQSMDRAVEEQTAAARDIAGRIEQIARDIDHVSDNAGISSQSASDTARDIKAVWESARNMSGSGDQVQTSAEQLRDLARDLKSAVGSFKI